MPRKAADPARIERETREIGAQIFERLQEVEIDVTDAAWWEEKILEFCMEHPELKVELFRFIDVLPVLRPSAVAEHLIEYLGHARADLPALLRFSLDLASPRSALGRLAARAARRNVRRMARRFIAGSTVGEVVAAIRRLRRDRMAVTIDVLGEAVIANEEANAYASQYVTLLREGSRIVNRLPEDTLIDRDFDGSALPRLNVSLKLSALAAWFDPIDPEGSIRSVMPRLCEILRASREAGGFVFVDMENYERKDLTLRIFQEAMATEEFRDFSNVGIVLQAYLEDTERDLIALGDWARARGAPIWVRLVKGAYWDYETVIAEQQGWPVPVFREKWQSDANFERCTDLLLDRADVLRPAFGSHNVRSLAHAMASARARGLPERFIELQTLYGMADPVKTALVALGERVRVYTPYGELIPGMAYLVRRLLENTSNESFLRHHVTADQSVGSLLSVPAPPPPQSDSPEKSMETKSTTRSRPTPVDDKPFLNEPLSDFSKESRRQHFSESLEEVRSKLGLYCPITIDGQAVPVEGRIVSVCPSDTSVIVGSAGAAGVAEADAAVAAAKGGAAAWRGTAVEERAAILDKAADVLGSRRFELAAWTCFEAGKPWRDADADIAEAMDFCRYYARIARRLFDPQHVTVAGEDNVTVYQPRGVTAVISPWNFPIAILCGMTAAALVTGNTVVMKPAEQTPICGFLLYDALRAAGVPPSALQYLPGDGETVGARLVEHPDTATIAFTGSRAVGHLIAKRAAETSSGLIGLKRVIAEMGGKNAVIIDDDCDLDEAVPGVLASAFGYAGQKCSAASRVIVLERIYERFSARLQKAAEAMVIGPAEDAATAVGPLIEKEAVDRVNRYVDEGARQGRIVFRGQLPPLASKGHFAPPTILEGLPADSPILKEEIFGPVLAMVRVADFERALEAANATEYGLTGGVYSRRPRHIERARGAFDVGNLYINRKITGALVGRQPFGGFRHSGMGNKAGGPDYLLQFVVARTICENTLRRGFAPSED